MRAPVLKPLFGLALIWLACVAAQRVTAVEPSETRAPAAVTPAKVLPRRPRHLTPEQSLEGSVQRLSKGLELDATQQARVRELLASERRQIRDLWTNHGQSQTDLAGSVRAIVDHTREQIRAVLNDEQQKKYPAPVARELTAPAQADTEHWLKLMQPAAGQGARDAN